jgi:hypothetical protein
VEEVRPASKRSGRSSRTSSAGKNKLDSRPGSAASRRPTTPATDANVGKPEGLLRSRNLTGEAADREQRMRDELNVRKQVRGCKDRLDQLRPCNNQAGALLSMRRRHAT